MSHKRQIKQKNGVKKFDKLTTQQKNKEIDSLLQEHATKDEENKWFCNKCGLKFIRSTSALYHLERVHDVEFKGAYKSSCGFCDKTFTNRDSLKQHYYRVHKEQDVEIHEEAPQYTYDEHRNYICNICQVTFRKRATLLHHLNNKHGISIEYKYICGLCKRVISSRAGLIAHVKSKHIDSKKDGSFEVFNQYNKCDNQNDSSAIVKVVCFPKGITRQNVSTQDEPTENTVSDSKIFDCSNDSICNETQPPDGGDNFVETERKNVKNNEDSVVKLDIKNEKKRSCDDRIFDEIQDDELRQCVACGSIVTSGDKLLVHIKTVHAEEYSQIKEEFSNYGSTSDSSDEDDSLDCNVCKQKFTNLKQYSLHVKLNHKGSLSPNRDSSSASSDVCNSTFKDKNELISHNNISRTANFVGVPTNPEEISNSDGTNSKDKNSNSLKTLFNINLIRRQCHLCKIIFPNEKLLSFHMNLKHSKRSDRLDAKLQTKNHECLICHKKFASNKCLRDHQRKEHSWKESISLICRICGSVLTSQFTLKSHVMAKHKDNVVSYEVFFIDTKGKHYTFEEVEKSISTDGNENNSGLEFKENEKYLRFKCKLCGKILKTRQSIVLHIKALHSNDNVQCPYCEYKCKVYKYLQIHITTKHPASELVGDNIQKYICDKCGYDTINKRAFISHCHRHKALHKCDLCGYSTRHQAAMISHKHKHDNKKPFKCEFSGCNYASVTRGQLKIHRMSHEPEKYTKCCDICGFKTVNPYIMNSHKKEHESGSIHRCSQCPYMTSSKINFRTHSSVHREPKSCVSCNFKTRYNQTMRSHMKLKHDVDIPKCSYPMKKSGINKTK